ncbi:MAG: YjgP/YjgQ family permease [Chitinophagaceae bacterium]|nr:YjgP/YjgQ family permease [Chitinophagaceae bacterium]
MFKKLDKLIIRAFIGPFVATFFITLFVLVMQFFWLYIDDFVGKGINTGIILKFIWYQSAVLVPLALPLAVLLSSLMTFGNLGESFELVAIKSAGISLLRFMRPLFIITFFISCIAFLFSNSIIPIATLKSRTLLSDIVNANPAFDLKEGVFYDKIPGFAVKIGKKEDNDSIIKDVIVYEQSNQLQDNFIIAKSGVMRVSSNKRFLEFDLKDGWRYQERGDAYETKNTEFVRIGFKEYKKQFDLSSFEINWTNDSVNKNNEKMYSIRQLGVAIDSLSKDLWQTRQRSGADINRMVRFAGIFDSASKKNQKISKAALNTTARKFDDILPDSAKATVDQQVQNLANSLRINAESFSSTLNDKERILRRHKIEWHRKITLSLACLVLFLIGAPLGSIIRKGGLGTPLIFAIIFFMIFYFSSTTGEKFAKEGTLTPFMGMWMATFILTPLGVFLTYKAMHDSHLFNKEFYARIARFVRRIRGTKK